jgi:hypothetical protein
VNSDFVSPLRRSAGQPGILRGRSVSLKSGGKQSRLRHNRRKSAEKQHRAVKAQRALEWLREGAPLRALDSQGRGLATAAGKQ